MRRSLARHLVRLKPQIKKIVATHAHEEQHWQSQLAVRHCWSSGVRFGDDRQIHDAVQQAPMVRATIIGQPPDLKQPYNILTETVDTNSGELQVISTPGHCDDHIVPYDSNDKLLIAGDAFMGASFATPNPDVDSLKWIASLEQLLELDIEILVEGHGPIHTLRTDIPDLPRVVVRENPKTAILKKLDYLRWLRKQIEAGFQEELPLRAVEATCFPWGSRSSWESCTTDECIPLLSLGHFSRTELVRSFARTDTQSLPTVYEIRLSGGSPK